MMAPRSRMTGIRWPAIAKPGDAQVLALQFQFEQTQWWPESRLLAHQMEQVRGLLDHAQGTVPFYRERLAPFRGLEPGTLTLEAYRRVPLLSRADIQEAGDALLSRRLPGAHGKPFDIRTSGSTGTPIRVKGTALTSLFLTALSLRGHLWHKRDLSAKSVTFRASVPKTRAGARQVWAAGYATGPSPVFDITRPVGDLFDTLIEEDPEYFQTHPNVLVELMRISRETGVKPKKLREVRTMSEVLDAGVRETCLDEWGVPVIDIYSANEIGTIAHQCPDNTQYHVQAESVLVEVLDEDGEPCLPGRMGRVVITVLHNFATPLIRYDIGDYAEAGAPCPCGRGLPVLTRVVGRTRNLMVLPTGEKVSSSFFEKRIAVIAPVRQFQLIQKTAHEIEVKLVVPRPLTEAEENGLRDYFTERAGHPFDFRFVYVDDIPRSAGGKYEYFRSEVTDPERPRERPPSNTDKHG
ncbi:MAG: phenylacetate--CoA ligase family protein [Rhodospirillales bacterium]